MSGTDNIALNGVSRQRLPRSRNGCLTCRRRKVRCGEQRPRCAHCERLNLQCTWNPIRRPAQSAKSHQGSNAASGGQGHGQDPRAEHHTDSTLLTDAAPQNLDFNAILWQNTSEFDSFSLDWPSIGSDPVQEDQDVHGDVSSTGIAQNTTLQESNQSWSAIPDPSLTSLPQFSPASWTSGVSVSDVERNALVEHFLASVVPPLLAVVEVGPKWTSTKLLLVSLAASSDMVQDSIAAFSALQLGDGKQENDPTYQLYYERCKREFLQFISGARRETTNSQLQSTLVVIFFLSYCALLSDRIDDAHVMLQSGAQLLRAIPTDHLSSTERRLISWIRLVDSKASSVGGPGTFVSETDVQTKEVPEKLTPIVEAMPVASHPGDELEEVLFDMLYTPGLLFYQRVQSIMARVSAIDKWHRTRGTVKDETEVMAIAALISQDLHNLELARPALMDWAVAGTLTEQHLMAGLSTAIVRSYRTYWANYHAGHIHLHRVAHTHLEATDSVRRARSTIKQIAHLLEESSDQLPANFIWPLLMACAEEEDVNERSWMITAIRSMQSGATNAKPIAQVLEEVHRRQDATKQRADIRQTSIDLFNKSFAVF